MHATNTSNLPVEALEGEYPLILERYELVDGSAGVGKHRGGMGLRRVYRATEDCMVHVDVSRNKSRSWGLQGGGEGGHGSYVTSPDCAPFERGYGTLRAGEWLEVITPGGGGYGTPEECSQAPLAPRKTPTAPSPASGSMVWSSSSTSTSTGRAPR